MHSPFPGNAASAKKGSNHSERRSSWRYEVLLAMKCRPVKTQHIIVGNVRNMSSGGVYIDCADTLPCGTKVQAYIDWPFFLNDSVPLQLRIQGSVVREDRLGIAIAITHYGFYTRRSIPAADTAAPIAPLA